MLRLALAQWQIGRATGLRAWTARLAEQVAVAAHAGAQMVVLPEYAALEAAAGDSPDIAAELARASCMAPDIVDAARAIAADHGVWLLPGTFPFAAGGRVVNRAPLISPDGAVRYQDKHVMTRFEAEEWGISPGAPPSVFETPWGRIGIAICFDAEFPTLVRAQTEAGAWLIVVPSCTDTPHGFARVRVAAAARAMENQCFVAVSPTVGDAPWIASLDRNCGHAALFGPIDRGFPEDGVIASGAVNEYQFVYADLDPAALQAVRRHGAVRNFASWPAPPPPCPIR